MARGRSPPLQRSYTTLRDTTIRRPFAPCTAPQLRMEAIDELVLGEVERRVLAPERMTVVLAKLLERRDSDPQATETELQRQQEALKKAESGLRNIFAAIADAPDLIRIDAPLTREQITLLNRQRA